MGGALLLSLRMPLLGEKELHLNMYVTRGIQSDMTSFGSIHLHVRSWCSNDRFTCESACTCSINYRE
jgi:hypothetical protein